MQVRDWWLNARIGKELDKRRKLNDEDKEYIKKLHTEGTTIREIARIYEKVCSRTLIQLVLFPERLEVIKKRQIENKNWIKYYNKDKRKEYMRTYRANIREKYNLKQNTPNITNDILDSLPLPALMQCMMEDMYKTK